MRQVFCFGAAALAGAAGLAPADCSGLYTAQILYTEIPGHPTAQAPGTGGQEFTAFLSLYTSPNGHNWICKGFVGASIDVIFAGTDETGSVVAIEGGATAIPGTTHSFVDSDCGINDAGQYAYGSRLLGATTLTDEVIFYYDGATESAAVVESDAAPGLFDPDGAGNELFGNSLNSTHVLNDGTVCFKADLIQNINSAYESALYQGSTVVSQEGTNAAEGEVIDGYIGLSGDTFSSSPDGSVWIVEADIDPSISSQEAVLVNNEVKLHDGGTLPGSALAIDAVFAVDVDNAGHWFARGDFTDDTDWVVRDGAVIAMTGTPITTGNAETWGDAIAAMNGHDNDYLLAGNTSNPDTNLDSVLVLNGETVIAREGDVIALDGSTNVAISSFSPEDVALTDDGRVLAFVILRDPDTGASLGDAFIEWIPVAGCNAADLAEPCGVLDLADVTAFIAGFLGQDPIADLDGNGIWDLLDVQAFISAFLNGCP
ncbi:MAG: hypothetical protein H6810_04960 [Phycisphaeraceae bacterium]|nr:MAG: hypothetical protein H6810_04960 [Phycisphaeraceae bacterium]